MRKAVRIGVLSDTHHDEAAMRLAMGRLQAGGSLDALCFLGDCVSDLDVIRACLPPAQKTAIYAVRGNNDGFSNLPDELTVSLGGKRVLLVHGHRQRVKMHRLSLLLHAEQQEVNIALFGHTHRTECGYERGILLLNPGAVCGVHATCAELEIRDDVVTPKQYELRA